MTVINNVSLLGQSTTQSERLGDLRSMFDNLSRQVTTQKKYEDYSGFGADAMQIQRLKTQQPLIQSYMSNIDRVTNRMTMVNNSLSSISKVGNDLISSITTLLQNGTVTISSIQQVAQQGLQTVEDLLNQQLDGHYIFGGSDVQSPPFVNDSSLNSNIKTQLTNWLASGNTAALTSTVDGFSGPALGLSSTLATSGNITARVDDNLDIDYTVKGDSSGMQGLLRSLTMIANLSIPGGGDVATQAQFDTVMQHLLGTTQDAVGQINDMAANLSGKFNLLKSLKDSHQSDLNLVQSQADTLENADPATALTQMQALQTQLTASYQVTNIVSKMSLTNYITI